MRPVAFAEECLALSMVETPHTRRAEALGAVGRRPGSSLVPRLRDAGYGDLAAEVVRVLPAARRAIDAARKRGIQVVAWRTPAYAERLTEIHDPPPVLWVRGQTAWTNAPAVAIVGSRSGSVHGLEVARRLARDLAAAGVVVVSGLARGVDSAAHRGALDAGGVTVAVLGSGVDVIYPPEHRGLSEEICVKGAVVSELPPGSPPLASHFPRRNRLISGLALGVIVVEASERSGSLITARLALEQGREVMAVPGNVLSARNRGAHALLKDGACLVESAEDVLSALGLPGAAGLPGGGRWAEGSRGCVPSRCSKRAPASLVDAPGAEVGEQAAATTPCRDGSTVPAPPRVVLAVMDEGETYDIDELAARSGLDSRTVLVALGELETAGAVYRDAAGLFVRAGRSC